MVKNNGKYFYTLVVGFCTGIALCDVLHISFYTLCFILLLSLSILFFLSIRKKVKGIELNTSILLCIIFFVTFSLGGFRVLSILNNEKELSLNAYEDKSMTLVARVSDELNNNKLLLNVFAVVENGEAKNISPENMIYDNAVGIFGYNDTLVVKGKIERPKNFDSKDGRDFDYVSYLKRQGIYHEMSFGSIVEQKQNDEITLRTILYRIKNWFIGNVESLVSEPESSLANGVTLAGKGVLPKDVQTDFVKAGLIHIVVLSGYNIAIVIRAMMLLFGMWGRRFGIIFAGVGIVLFVIMTGGTPPVVRSAIMASITLLGTLSYKTVLQNRALFGAVFVMVFWNPYSLLYDASFALSMLATFAIINCAEPVKKSLTKVTEKFQVKQILSETLATQIIVLPYLLYEIGNLSIVAPISNIIILPLIPWIMLLTFIVGMIAFIPIVSLPFAGLLILLSSFVIWGAHFLANIPFGYFQIRYFPLWAMGLCYLGFYIFALWIERKRGVGMEKVESYDLPY
ncbi:MAG: internalization-related competence protein ComEC/Rec2, competence protein ComEC protein [Candidatus Taylorbacteria bacterium]|nr:internalization-related competence protein ComEC/Rec2, competence protein ComEC protein [Candidatus Taylorbacteria bacterium]